MSRRPALRAEILVGLSLVMALGSLSLGAVFAAQQEAGLRRVLGRALLAEARADPRRGDRVFPDTDWWVEQEDGELQPRGAVGSPIDEATRGVAAEARRRGVPLVRPGGLADRIRFAAPLPGGRVVVGRLPRRASVQLRLVPLAVVASIALANVLVFTALGDRVLRRRVIEPLEGLVDAARAVGEGDFQVRAQEDGTRETVEVARSFNEMASAVEARSSALEKAIAGLRSANEELRRTRAHLDRSERLAAVGRLAAGVAHEVGNPIGAILAFVEVASRDPHISEASRGHLQRAGREGERVRRILRQLLDLSRPSRVQRGPVDLAALAERTRALVVAQRRYEGIAVELVAAPGTPNACADEGVVAQILLNLLVNACDAVRSAGGGRVRVEVGPCSLRQRRGDPPGADAARRRADGVTCRVEDDGPGIAGDDLHRVFDPFFTTKEPGEGTGLGLANALRGAEELDGSLGIEPAGPGFRTAFVLRLPALGAESATEARREG